MEYDSDSSDGGRYLNLKMEQKSEAGCKVLDGQRSVMSHESYSYGDDMLMLLVLLSFFIGDYPDCIKVSNIMSGCLGWDTAWTNYEKK